MQFYVVADSPDDRLGFVVGPLAADEEVVALATEMRAAGWKATGVRQHVSVAEFRNLVAAKQGAATAAGKESE
jgi:hypothetical protein